mmetsp:Transcript_23340/g.51223  ORF Transcript_23340/g.51223 Transcript_23340/m.51223 type:complete len:330 (-) Transcript_23340:389-1378(-)
MRSTSLHAPNHGSHSTASTLHTREIKRASPARRPCWQLCAGLVVQLLLVLAPASRAEAGTPTCPPPGFDSVPRFDLAAYISAPWYVQKQLPVSYQPPSELYCVRARYKAIDPNNFEAGINVYNTANRGGVDGPPVGTNNIAPNGSSGLVAVPASSLPQGPFISVVIGALTSPSPGPAVSAAGVSELGTKEGGAGSAQDPATTAASKLEVGPEPLLPLARLNLPVVRRAFGPYWVVAVGPSSNETLKYDWAVVSGGPPRYRSSSGKGCTTLSPALPAALQYSGGLWLFTRKPNDPVGAQAAEAAAADLGFDTSGLLPVKQDGCTYSGAVP